MLQKNTLQIDNEEDLIVLESLKCFSKQFSNEKLVQFNTDILFFKAKEYGLVHCVFDYYKESKTIRDKNSPFYFYTQIADEYFLLLKKAWNEINIALRENSIDSLVCKGFHLLNTVYKKKSKYIINDIDILVKRNQLAIVKEVIKNIGYSQNILNTSESIITFIENDVISEFENIHYELFPFTKVIEAPQFDPYIDFIRKYLNEHPFIIENNKIYVAIELDIHHNLSIGFDEKDIWKNHNKFTLNKIESGALGYDTLGWFLPARLYYEIMVFNKVKIKMLADIACVITSKGINYDAILKIADKYYLHPSLFYVYSYLKNVVEIPISEKFIEQLNSRIDIKSSYRDWGDFMPKVLNVRMMTSGFVVNSKII